MEILTIDELIGHCNRVLEKHTSGTKVYQEHESVRHHLQVLRQYLRLELPLVRLRELIDSMKVNHIILTPLAVGQPVYITEGKYSHKIFYVEHIDIWDEDCPTYYCKNENELYCFDGDDIGETVFLTPAEADEAAKRKEDAPC